MQHALLGIEPLDESIVDHFLTRLSERELFSLYFLGMLTIFLSKIELIFEPFI
jgi:hypothetical protein